MGTRVARGSMARDSIPTLDLREYTNGDANSRDEFVEKMGVNYKPGIWHFPLISTENTNFLVIDRKGSGKNLVIHKFEKEEIVLEYEK